MIKLNYFNCLKDEYVKNGLKLRKTIAKELSFLFSNGKLVGVAGVNNDELFIKTYLLEENDD